MEQINANTQVIINKAILSTEVDNEIILLSIESGKFYGLNIVSAKIWKLLDHQILVCDLIDQLQNEFDVEKEQCESEVFELLNTLLSKDLIEII